jgi:RNA polymerase sigma factor (sigma-70 family)
MSHSALAAGVRHLRRAMAAQRHRDESDEQLLHAFLDRRDDSAFAVLVHRHGPMVMGVCRRVLGHQQDAEDAFQATFLVLARNAAALHKKTALAGFLHGTAYRTALTAKRAAARRRKHERQAPVRQADDLSGELLWREVRTLLDEEIARLPEIYRSVFVLCCLEGGSQAEAARRLGLKEATVSSRLAGARKRLQTRLSRRGVELTALLAAATLTTESASALPAALLTKTIEDAVSPAVAALANSGPSIFGIGKAKLAMLLLTASLLGGSGVLVHFRQAAGNGAPPAAEKAKPQPQARPAAKKDQETATFAGLVLDPDGKPVGGAKVVFYQRRPDNVLPDFFPAPTMGTTDADGRFRFTGNVHLNAPVRNYRPLLILTAHVPGYGPAAVRTNSPDELKDRTLRLVKDDVAIRGRILNLEGRPIAGVTVRPVAVVATAAGDLGRLIETIEANKNRADLPEDCRPNISFLAAAAGLTQTTKTDNEGKFTLSGFGRERIVALRLDGPTIATSLLNAMTRKGPTVRATRPPSGDRILGGLMPPKPLHEPPATHVYTYGNLFDFVVGPGMVVEGTVRDQDTGKPIAGVVVRHGLGRDSAYNFGWAKEELATKTDAAGCYRLAGLPRTASGAYQAIQFVSPRDQPYLPVGFSPPATEFGKPANLEVGLKRGVWAKGRVTDKVTGRPVQAVVEYFAFADNPELRGIKGLRSSQVVSSKKDGSFAFAVLRGRGIVAVQTDEMRRGTYLYGQGEDTISGPRDMRIESFITRPYMCRFQKFNTLVGIEPDAKVESVACDVQLDPGKTVQGTILDPEGKPLAGASIRGPFLSLVELRDLPSAEFAIPAVNPRKPEAYFFEHPKRNLAAAVILKGDEPAGFTVKMKPTATIKGRIVTEQGEPVRNTDIHGHLEAGQLNMTRDWNGFFWGRTDAEGRFKIEGLLAGVKLGGYGGNLFKNLTLQPGEVRNLGDIKIKDVSEKRPKP